MAEATKKTFGTMPRKTFGSPEGGASVEARGILDDHKKGQKEKKLAARKTAKEKYTQKLTLYLTEGQRAKLSEKSGLAGDATYLRHYLEQSGFFE